MISLVAEAGRMSRSDSVKLHLGTPKSRCGVRLPENCYAPIAYKCIVIHHCYDQTLTANARVGTGNFCDSGRDRLIRIEKSGRKTGYILLMRKCSGKPQNALPASFNVGEEMLWTIGRKAFWRINHFLNANRQQRGAPSGDNSFRYFTRFRKSPQPLFDTRLRRFFRAMAIAALCLDTHVYGRSPVYMGIVVGLLKSTNWRARA